MMSKLSTLWARCNDFLFPILQQDLEPLSDKQRQFIAVCELAALDQQMGAYLGHRRGRKKKSRVDFAKAFIAKAVYDLRTTKLLIEYLGSCPSLRRLCGWEHKNDLPCEATFSNAFAEFAAGNLGDLVHQAMVQNYCGEKLAGHISRDATAIQAREKAAPKPKKTKQNQPRKKRGRPKKNEQREPLPPRRLELQPGRKLAQNLVDLPDACDWGRKKNSKGKVRGLERLQIASGRDRRRHPDQRNPDLGLDARLASRDSAGADERRARHQSLRPDGRRLRRQRNTSVLQTARPPGAHRSQSSRRRQTAAGSGGKTPLQRTQRRRTRQLHA